MHRALPLAILIAPSAAPAGPPSAFEPVYGERETFTAVYRVDPIPSGNKLQPVVLVREDGEVWIRAYRPVPGEYRFADKRVVVTGRPYWPGPGVAHLGGTHVEVEKIELAPGETPREGPHDVLPPPPEATTVAAVAARAGLWVRVHGTLAGVVEGEPGGAGAAEIALADGARIRAEGVTALDLPRWKALVGQEVTVVGRVRPRGDEPNDPNDPVDTAGAAPAKPWSLWGTLAICPGRVSRCGMEAPRRGQKLPRRR